MLSRRHMILASLAGSLLLATPFPARADTDQAAREFVTGLSRQAIQVMTSPSMPDAERIEKFHKLFMSSVDLPQIGRLVLARYWRIATPEQQQEFLKLFENMLVLTWSGRFKGVAGDVTLTVVGVRPDVEQGVAVDTQILRDQQEPVQMTWRLRPADSSFRIVDLIVEGTSMIFTYRDEFASVITQRGGKVEGLLVELRKKVAQLSQITGARLNEL